MIGALDGSNSFNEWTPLTKLPDGAFSSDNGNGDVVQALISTPVAGSGDNSPKFATSINLMKTKIQQLVPSLQRIQVLTYQPPASSEERDTIFETTAKGKLLTNYDPQAYSNGDHGYQVWAEYAVGMQDRWNGNTDCSNDGDSSASNSATNGGNQKRQVCTP